MPPSGTGTAIPKDTPLITELLSLYRKNHVTKGRVDRDHFRNWWQGAVDVLHDTNIVNNIGQFQGNINTLPLADEVIPMIEDQVRRAA